MSQAFTHSARMAAIRLQSVHKQIFQALLSLASAALLVRVGGMVNQIVTTSRFGEGATMDAYFLASTFPLVLPFMIIGVIEASFIPIYIRLRSQEKNNQANAIFSTVMNMLLIGVIILILLMLVFRQQIVHLLAPAIDSNRAELAFSLTPFIYPAILLMVVIGYLESILNAEGQFGWPAYAGLLVPLTTAVFVLLFGASQGIVVLCLGMLVGLCLQFGMIIFRTRHTKLVYRPIINLHNPEISTILSTAWPALLGTFISQAGPLVDQVFASFLPAGTISSLNYALKIISVFTGVIFVSFGRAALPYLSRQVAINDMKAFKETLHLTLWVVGFCTTLLTIFLLVLVHPIVRILFQHGAFSADDTNHTATILIGFAVGLVPMSFNYITVRAFNAIGKTNIVMRVAIFSVTANALFDYIFVHFWQSQGIALATSVVYTCTMLILLFILHRMIGDLHLFTPPSELLQVFRKVDLEQFYLKWIIGKKEDLFFNLSRYILRMGIIITTFTAGTVGIFLNSIVTLRLTAEALIVLVLLRYRYILLVLWVMLNGPNGLPVFRGSNVLIGLTIPTLAFMFVTPLKQTFKRMPALSFLLIFLLWAFASIGISPIGVGPFLTFWTELLDCLMVSVLVVNLLTTRRQLLQLIDATILVTTFISLYGVYGYISKQNGVVDPTTLVFRIGSVFGDTGPQSFSLFLSIVIPLALYRTFTLKGFKRIGISLLVFIFVVTLMLTFTRIAYISLPLSVIIMILFLPSRKIKMILLSSILIIGVLTVLLATIGNFPIFGRFFGQDISTFNGRTYLWQAILDHFDPTQILGKGLGASDFLLTELHIGINGQGLIGTSPHSLFLGTLYDHGIIGVTLLILVFIVLLVSLIYGMRRATSDRRMLFVVAFAVLISVLIQSFETNGVWEQGVSIYFWVVMALPFAYCWSIPRKLSKIDEEFFDKLKEPQIKAIRRAEVEQVSQV